MEIKVLRAGLLTTVQDLGRRGHRGEGVPLGGAMDVFALRVANLLVGNPEDAAGLEITMAAPELEFSEEALIAVCGADFGTIPSWQPVAVRAGERLRFGPCLRGFRGCLALSGGVDVPWVLGGRGTYLPANFGGLEGRALRDGDVLRTGSGRRRVLAGWHLDARILPAYSNAPTVRIVRGAQGNEFGKTLEKSVFRISPQSDRMGLRLDGPRLERSSSSELASSAVVPGTVQVPPDGSPIVVMADAQTLGGYPQVAHAIGVDQPLLAQLRPGDHVSFREVSLDDAHAAAVARERNLGMLRQGLEGKFA